MSTDVVTGVAPSASSRVALPVAAVAMAIVALVGEPHAFTAVSVTALALGLVPWALIAAGVRVPMLALMTVAIAVAYVVVVAEANPGGMFPVMIAVVWAALNTDDRRVIVGVLIAAASPMIVRTADNGSMDEDGTVYMLSGVAFSCFAGWMLRRQYKLTAELRALHELHVEHAAAAERTHIAREVHDVVAHSLTVVMLHLTGARRALATDPERAGEALERAEKVGRESLDSVRQVVGLLRSGDAGSAHDPDPPQPSITDITDLIDGYSAGGLAVTTRIDLDGVDPDPATQLVVYRIVQESLSNVLQYAPGATCEVHVWGKNESLGIVVVNTPAAVAGAARPSPDRVGLGLRGMRERVRASGGTLDAGPTDDGGWQVSATLPLRNSTPREVTWSKVPTRP